MTWSGQTPGEHDPRLVAGAPRLMRGREGAMRKSLRSTGVAVGVLGLLLGTMAGNPAMASPDDELVWEQGVVTSVADGDTITANLTSGSGAPRRAAHSHDRRPSTRGGSYRDAGGVWFCSVHAEAEGPAPDRRSGADEVGPGLLQRRLLRWPHRSVAVRPGRGGQLVRQLTRNRQRGVAAVVPAGSRLLEQAGMGAQPGVPGPGRRRRHPAPGALDTEPLRRARATRT